MRSRPLEYNQIDVMADGQEHWKNLYEFDTPVLHVQRVEYTYAKKDTISEAGKLMHRFTDSEVNQLLDKA